MARKNKLRLSLEVHNSPTVLNNQNKARVTKTIELEMDKSQM